MDIVMTIWVAYIVAIYNMKLATHKTSFRELQNTSASWEMHEILLDESMNGKAVHTAWPVGISPT